MFQGSGGGHFRYCLLSTCAGCWVLGGIHCNTISVYVYVVILPVEFWCWITPYLLGGMHNFIADFRVPVYLYVVVLPVEFGVGFRAGCRVEHGCVAQ